MNLLKRQLQAKDEIVEIIKEYNLDSMKFYNDFIIVTLKTGGDVYFDNMRELVQFFKNKK